MMEVDQKVEAIHMTRGFIIRYVDKNPFDPSYTYECTIDGTTYRGCKIIADDTELKIATMSYEQEIRITDSITSSYRLNEKRR